MSQRILGFIVGFVLATVLAQLVPASAQQAVLMFGTSSNVMKAIAVDTDGNIKVTVN